MQHQYTCKNCGKEFASKLANRKFCSSPCANKYRSNTHESFWSHVDKSGGPQACWTWLLSKDKDGYGWTKVRNHSRKAHRIAWELTFGKIPSHLLVCHRCDVHSCVNPNHLFLGTPADNSKDMTNKDRQAKGEHIGISKLTPTEVAQIRERYANESITQKQLAQEYGVVQTGISKIINHKEWKHV